MISGAVIYLPAIQRTEPALPALEERSGEHWLYLPAVQQKE